MGNFIDNLREKLEELERKEREESKDNSENDSGNDTESTGLTPGKKPDENSDKSLETLAKKIKKKGIILAIPILAAFALLKSCGGESNQEDALYKIGQTNNIEAVELKKGLEMIENGTCVIQEIHGDNVKTWILTAEGLQDITKFEKNFSELNIEFNKTATFDANEVKVELMPMSGNETYPKKYLLEGAELLVKPDYGSRQDGKEHVVDLWTGEEGYVDSAFLKDVQEIVYNPNEEESTLCIVGTPEGRRADITSTEYEYEGHGENVTGYIGSYEKGMEFAIAAVDKDNPNFLSLYQPDGHMYVNVSQIALLYQLTKDGIKEEPRASEILNDKNENNTIEKNHFEIGVVAKGATVGGSIFSKGKNIENKSLYIELPDGKAYAVIQDGVANISSTDKTKIGIHYSRDCKVYGYGNSVPILNEEGRNIEDMFIVDGATVSILPEDNRVIGNRTLVPIFDKRTKTKGYLDQIYIPNPQNTQFEFQPDSELFILKANEETPVRTSEQNKEGYYDNIDYKLSPGEDIIVEYNNNKYKVKDPRHPELEGDFVVDLDKVLLEYQITPDGIEEIKQDIIKDENDEKQGEKISMGNNDFRQRIVIRNGNHTNEVKESSNDIIKNRENRDRL